MQKNLFHSFKQNVSGIAIPEKFTFPFFYEPHQLSKIATSELQNYLENQIDWEHNFGLDETQNGLVIGKMFGVLVVQNQENELGYLAAFSGKLAETNHLPYFVPTVFDMLEEEGFFKKEEQILNKYNKEIDQLVNSESYLTATNHLIDIQNQADTEINAHKEQIKLGKAYRAKRREVCSIEELRLFEQMSQAESILLKKLKQHWHNEIINAKKDVDFYHHKINALKETRRVRSSELQKQLFENYSFLNQHGELKSLEKIFKGNPPAGAGECAAPKLLHYAFQHQLKPIAMAEFWWGQSPKSEVRKHKQFYPACMGKCEPILKHMLEGMNLEDNPFIVNPAEGKELDIVFEDDYLVVIDKPSEFLSVPGKQITDSVYTRMKEKYPEATGPLVVHRLDMSTSGLLLIAKSSEIYKKLQSQFIKRQIKKRYVALLDGALIGKEGVIDLPLRVDLDNRPNQIVCYKYGKKAETHWEVIQQKGTKTLVYFYPITGRTHQLRVHAAHVLGLDAPIVGDDLYGTKANRLHLHAESITFQHPISKEIMTISKEAEFSI